MIFVFFISSSLLLSLLLSCLSSYMSLFLFFLFLLLFSLLLSPSPVFFFSLSSSLFSLCLLSPCVVVCVSVCVVWCGVCRVVWHAEKPVCRLKNASV